MSDDVLVMRAGREVESGPTGSVLRTPCDDYTRELIAAVLVPDPSQARWRRAS